MDVEPTELELQNQSASLIQNKYRNRQKKRQENQQRLLQEENLCKDIKEKIDKGIGQLLLDEQNMPELFDSDLLLPKHKLYEHKFKAPKYKSKMKNVEELEKRKQDLQTMKQHITAQNADLINQRNELNNSLQIEGSQNFFKDFKHFISAQKRCNNSLLKDIAGIYEDIQSNQSLKTRLRKQRFSNNNVIKEIRFDLSELNMQMRELVGQMNIHELAALSVPNIHHKVNDLWIWVMECVYFEHQQNYYWKNFQDQVFLQDNGKDYKNRLNGHNTSLWGEREGRMTVKLLEEQNEILEDMAEEGNVKNDSFELHFEIAQVLNNKFELYQKIRSLDKDVKDFQEQEGQLKHKIEQGQVQLKETLKLYQSQAKCFNTMQNLMSFVFCINDNRSLTMSVNTIKRIKTGMVSRVQNAKQNIVNRNKGLDYVKNKLVDVDVEGKREECKCTVF